MSKQFTPKNWMPAVGIVTIALVAVAALAGSSHWRAQRNSNARVSAASQAPAVDAAQRGRFRANLDALPLAFEANQGQTNPQVKYLARGNGYNVFLTANEMVFAMSPQASGRSGRRSLRAARQSSAPTRQTTAVIYMKPLGGNPHPEIAAGRELPGHTNYFIGSDRSQWLQGVKQYASVNYRNVYPGVDMAFHGEQRHLEFDFIVAPGANPSPISLGVHGAGRITTDAAGNLILSSKAGDVMLHKPVAYQEKNNTREPVDASFAVQANNNVTFALGTYDRSRDLVIDPTVSYATYLGGAAEDEAFAIAVDGSGNAYVTGQTKSLAFNGITAGPNFDVFVTKANSGGTAFVYTDIFSATGTGSGDCSGTAIAVDGPGNAYVAGIATAGFPTATAYQSTFGGGTQDAFALKVDTSGTVVYSTYLGGTGQDNANGIAVDGSGNAYVAGQTQSSNFPLMNPFITTNPSGNDGFVTKLNSTGNGLVYSTYIGGSNLSVATGIAVDSSGNAYVSGITISQDFPTTTGVVQPTFGGVEDGFVAEIKPDGSGWVYSTFLGGSGTDDALGVAVDAAGEAYVTGNTNSTNFPTSNAVQPALGGSSATNVFVTKLSAGGTALVFSTYYGGALDDVGTGIALDSFGDAYVTGRTTSSTYPVSNAFQQTLSGTSDAFVTEFSNTGFVVYSSFMGGAGTENDALLGSDNQGPIGAIAVDSSSNAYLAGATSSTTSFPATALQTSFGGGAADAFVAKVGAAPADFSVAASPSSASATSGQSSGTVTVSVASVNASYGQPVTLSCGNLPAKAVCHFTSGSVTPGSTAQTSSLTIATNGASSASLVIPGVNRLMFATLFPICGVALLGLGFSKRKPKLGLLCLGFVMAALLTLPACGGSGNGGGGGGGGGTAKGNYSITVIGSAGGTTHSAPLTLTVN